MVQVQFWELFVPEIFTKTGFLQWLMSLCTGHPELNPQVNYTNQAICSLNGSESAKT